MHRDAMTTGFLVQLVCRRFSSSRVLWYARAQARFGRIQSRLSSGAFIHDTEELK